MDVTDNLKTAYFIFFNTWELRNVTWESENRTDTIHQLIYRYTGNKTEVCELVSFVFHKKWKSIKKSLNVSKKNYNAFTTLTK